MTDDGLEVTGARPGGRLAFYKLQGQHISTLRFIHFSVCLKRARLKWDSAFFRIRKLRALRACESPSGTKIKRSLQRIELLN